MAELSFGSLAEFAGHISKLTVNTEHHQHEALERAAELVENTAKEAIGTYDLGWKPLAPSTVVRKGADTPLLETGELRNSIQHKVVMEGFIGSWNHAYVGSNLDRAVYQELGTSRIPPRPFLMGAATHKEAEVVHILGGGALKGIVRQT